jgi:hypothetical protein
MARLRREGRLCQALNRNGVGVEFSIEDNTGCYRYLPEPTDEFDKNSFEVRPAPRAWMSKVMMNRSSDRDE